MLGRALRLGSQLTVLHLESAILSGRPLMILGASVFINSNVEVIKMSRSHVSVFHTLLDPQRLFVPHFVN